MELSIYLKAKLISLESKSKRNSNGKMIKIENLTKQLIEEIGEDPSREGLLKTPSRVSKAWSFSQEVIIKT